MQKLNINIPYGSGAKSSDINKTVAKVNELIDAQDNLDAAVAQRLNQEAEQRSKLQDDVSNRLSTAEVTLERGLADAQQQIETIQEQVQRSICAIEISDDGDIILTTSDSSNIVSGEMTDDGDIILNIQL